MAAIVSPRDLADALVLNAIRLTRTLRALRRNEHLTGPEISALAVIVYSKRIAARDLARLEEVTPATISRLVAAMEVKGLVRRTPDRRDSRLQWIAATPLGVRRINEGHERRLGPLVALLAALPREKRAKLADAAAILSEVIVAVQVEK
jgi:DNA-binding MarR family transcriptional regulator